jgi:hypothetical protein
MTKNNKLEGLRALQLMCQSMDKVIDLHRTGYELYEDVLQRALMMRMYIDSLLEKEKSQ